MSPLPRLALRSLWNRRFTASLTLASITISVVLLVGVEKIRTEAREGFASTISGTDLVVGARTSPVQLLLASIFRIGDATANVRWESYERIARHPLVAWSVPLALGDSHRGFRVVGTTDGYLEHYRYGRDRRLALAEGAWFTDLFDVVLGAEVAEDLGYGPGTELVLSHGTSAVSILEHDELPFRVSGVLARTGTPVDRAIHVSLEAVEAIHVGWESGVPLPGQELDAPAARERDLTPETVTAFLLGLKSRAAVFQVQQAINGWPEEALLAVLPGVALQQLWRLIGVAEDALLLISAFVVLAGLAGMTTMLLASLSERRRELAILRAVGARPLQLFGLLTAESTALAAGGALAGTVLLYGGLALAAPSLQALLGVRLEVGLPGASELGLLGAVVVGGFLAGTLPAWRAYRLSLADGLTPRS
ncbi:MAG: ABC transporter permease [Pseudomonadales bacterium]|jgi:putative ABC transport system permease protein|nr:ABC transporter permease [Pseudomonadales bacterium]